LREAAVIAVGASMGLGVVPVMAGLVVAAVAVAESL
jgi:hypothetical protein